MVRIDDIDAFEEKPKEREPVGEYRGGELGCPKH